MNVYDIETFEENTKIIPYCIAFILNNKKFCLYYETDKDIIIESIKILAKNAKKNKIVIYVHNINFDGIIIINSLFINNVYCDVIKRKLNIYAFSFRYLGVLFEFKCSYKFIPLSLKKLGNMLNQSKGTLPYRFVKRSTLFYVGCVPDKFFFEKDEDAEFFLEYEKFDLKEVVKSYCITDVIILKKVLDELVCTLSNFNLDFIKLFKKSYSIPAFSQKIFFKYYNTLNIQKFLKIEHYAYIKNSYFGGRCEIFGNPLPSEIVHFFDFSGMYGQCMLEEFPLGEPFVEWNPVNIDKPGFYHIDFISNLEIPVLPVKVKSKLYFPNGRAQGIYWWEEIIHFKNSGGELEKINYGLTYKKTGFAFKKFIEEFGKMRASGGYKKEISKLIVNSLYGGFGMKEDDSFTVITFSEKEFADILESVEVINYFKIGNCFVIEILKNTTSSKIFNKFNSKWSSEFTSRNLTYASIIASKARIKLHSAMRDVIQDGGRLLYCDTDSIFACYNTSKLGNVCGEVTWSDLYDDACFIQPKLYGLKKKDVSVVKIKGSTNRNVSFEEVKNIFYNDSENIKLNNLVFEKKNLSLTQTDFEKTFWINQYNKRIFSKNKRFTTAVCINEEGSHPF